MPPGLLALHDILAAIASQRRLRLAYDTHYDADNLVLSWWQGNTRHCLDFQPLHAQPLQVTHYREIYPFLPKVLYWAHNSIPMFPMICAMQWQVLGHLSAPYAKTQVDTLISGLLPPSGTS